MPLVVIPAARLETMQTLRRFDEPAGDGERNDESELRTEDQSFSLSGDTASKSAI
jgi:hypothetical protein